MEVREFLEGKEDFDEQQSPSDEYPNAKDLKKTGYGLSIESEWPFREGDVLVAKQGRLGIGDVEQGEKELEVIDIKRVEEPSGMYSMPSLIIHFRGIDDQKVYYDSAPLSDIE